MKGFLIRWIINTLTLVLVVGIVPGIHAESWEAVAVAALILGLLNAFLRPLIILFTLPLNIISLGFFTLLINGFMFYLVSKVVEGFYITSFGSAFWGALFFSIISFLLNLFINPQGQISIRFYQGRSFSSSRDEDIIDVEGKSEDDQDHKRRITHFDD